MNLEEFVNDLSIETFNELRKTVIARHHKHSEEVVKALEYLTSQPVLCKTAVTDRDLCERALVEQTKLSSALIAKVVDRYLQLKDHFDSQNQNAEIPLEK